MKRVKRRAQSRRDKEAYFYHLGEELQNPLKEYRALLRAEKSRDSNPIPTGLINLSAEIIVLFLTKQRIRGLDLHINPVGWLYKRIRKILQVTNLSYSVFLLGMLYIHRFKALYRFHLTTEQAHETFLAAVITADKYLCDATFTNKDWLGFAEFKFSLFELNRIERNFLITLKYQVHVQKDDYLEFIEYLDMLLCTIQIHNSYKYGSLRYSDVIRLSGSFGRWNMAKLKVRFRGVHTIGTIVSIGKKIILVTVVYFGIVFGFLTVFEFTTH